MIRAHFRVEHPDLQWRPEYLGGGTIYVNVSEVPQTSETTTGTAGSPQGNLAAFATGLGRINGFVKSVTEHSIIMAIGSVRADLNYQQRIPREYLRNSRLEYYLPALAHLGEQVVTKKELHYTGTATDDEVFGYQERWAEYRHKPNLITGKMRSPVAGYTDSLDAWHLAQDFDVAPNLNQAFIEENPPMDRVLAITNQPHFKLDGWFDYQIARPMPTFSVPGQIDRF